MPLPTIDQLYEFFRDHALPDEKDVDPAYKDKTVAADVRPCEAEDARVKRLYGYKDNADNVLFLPYGTVVEKDVFRDIDDSLYRRLLGGTGGLVYRRTTESKSGAEITLGPSVLDLCRDDAVYATSNSILNNDNPNVPGLREVDFDFAPGEIIALVKGLKVDGKHYGVDVETHRRLMIFPDMVLIDAIGEFLKNPSCPIPSARREAMQAAFDKTMAYEKKHEKQQEDQIKNIKASTDKSNSTMIVLTLLGTMPVLYLTMRQMGLTSGIEAVTGRIVRNTFKTPAALFGAEGAVKAVWKGTFGPSSPIAVDITGKLKKLALPLTQTAQEILDGFDRGAMPHVILSGPSGSGKGHSTKTAGSAVVQGKSGVEVFEDAVPRYVTISAGAVVREAGSWLNKAEEIFFKTLDRYTNAPTIIHLTEADGFAEAGMGPGNKPLNLLKKLYEIMESVDSKYGNLFFILDSTRWKTIEEAAPDLLRRTSFVETQPALPQEIRKALEVNIQSSKSGSEGKILQKRHARATFTAEALDAITALGDFERGAPPFAHITVMNNILAEMDRKNRGNTASITIGLGDVVSHVARKTKQADADVKTKLGALLAGGVENNVGIEDRIVAAYYREYPNPKHGFFNPLKPSGDGGFGTLQEAFSVDLSGIRIKTADAADIAKSISKPIYTVKDFEKILAGKYETLGAYVDDASLGKMAKTAFDLWDKDGRKMDNVKGRLIPKEIYFEKVVDALAKRLTPEQRGMPSGMAFLELQKKPAREETLVERLPEEMGKMAEKILETSLKGEVK